MQRAVLVTGPSGSGKSTLADALAEELRGEGRQVRVLKQDSYFFGEFIPYSRCKDDTLERPDRVKWDEFVAHAAEAGRDTVVILEGHSVLNCDELVKLAGLIVYLDVGRDTCRTRRVGRRSRPEADNAALRAYFDAHVWPAHERYVVPVYERLRASGANVVCLSDGPIEEAVRRVTDAALQLQPQ
eukprot:TRINITY_DN40573_c0_g1_i1.p1 TRINITY_DN40573_c0_g1~~TRINITY_DN40573_c0_g1_i1.p1  ORF type:complete len:185 (+),score=57.90 TRINITY_DN40573_c0_g1_i1:48-602(+)